MFKYIEQLQKKPENYRKRVAIGTSAGITVILFCIWVSVSFYQTSLNNTIVAEKSGPPGSPLENLRASALDGLGKLKTQFDDAKQKINFLSDEYQKAVSTSTGTSTDESLIEESIDETGTTGATTSTETATGTSPY